VVIQVAEDIDQPNGLVLSPDDRVLYAADARGEWVLAYDVQPDGSLANRREFARLEGVPSKTKMNTQATADGLAVDGEGRLYVATRIGVEVFDRTGRRLGAIPVTGGTGPQNLAFAGPAKDILFVVGQRSLWRVQMVARGFLGRAK
jgi:gluconolactonase